MTKADFDKQLKTDSSANSFTVEGDYITFDKKSNQNYQLLPKFKLGQFLTANPLSKTKINKNLLVSLANISEAVDYPITIRSTYQSPEFYALSFGLSDSKLYITGDAIGLGVSPSNLQSLIDAVDLQGFKGEIFYYPWGIHLGYTNAGDAVKDYRTDTSLKQKIKNIISNDKVKKIAIIGLLAGAGWFFFLRKK